MLQAAGTLLAGAMLILFGMTGGGVITAILVYVLIGWLVVPLTGEAWGIEYVVMIGMVIGGVVGFQEAKTIWQDRPSRRS